MSTQHNLIYLPNSHEISRARHECIIHIILLIQQHSFNNNSQTFCFHPVFNSIKCDFSNG